MSRLHVWLIAVIVVVAIVAVLLLRGEPVSWLWFASIGIAVSAVVGAQGLFDLWIWRLGIFQGWLVKRPHLWGKWTVTLRPQRRNGDAIESLDPIRATLSIRQTYFSIHARLESRESHGNLICGQIIKGEDERYRFAGIYRNVPSLEHRDRSPMHDGVFLLDIEGHPNKPSQLRGSYWTDRQTRGEMVAVPQRTA